MDLLTTCIHHSKLHFTDHWHTQTKCPQSSIVFTSCCLTTALTVEILQLPELRSTCHSNPCRTVVSWQLNWFPGWRSFHTNLLVFSSQADFQVTTDNRTLTHQPSTSRHFTQLNCWQMTAARLVSSLYNLGADSTENTASNNTAIVVMGGRVAIGRVSLTCLPAVTK
jgi:hypothetical protein